MPFMFATASFVGSTPSFLKDFQSLPYPLDGLCDSAVRVWNRDIAMGEERTKPNPWLDCTRRNVDNLGTRIRMLDVPEFSATAFDGD